MATEQTYQVSWHGVKALHDSYWSWNSALRATPWAKRGANIPEALTEAIVCLCTGAELITQGSGDVLLPDGRIGEVKATSLDTSDLSSFSPSETWDTLFFVWAKPTSNPNYLVYDTNMNRQEVGELFVNSFETFDQQASANRRPRFSVIKSIIDAKGLKPSWHVDMKNQIVNT